MAVNYKKCPKCGSKNSVKIVYGMPSFKLFQEAEAGKVKLGGCCIIEGGPEYYCKDCKNEWNREQVLDIIYGQIKGLKASVGGYFGGYYHVDIDLKNLKTTWLFKEGGSEKTSTRSIRNKTAEEFIKSLKEINLLNWKAKYVEPGVCDGTQWSVDIGFPLKMGILASLEIIVIPIWIDFKLPKKPAKTELTMIFFNKLVNGYSISFAKNAAAFFKKAISFSFSASSRRNLLFSSKASVCSCS